mmetsp:Transcript_18274/g.23782  ORF Transcript_18274/g.23782 Transcript_18274/m.23782 type:complete len:319 (+) Transcript_18274:66-1022(+)
MSVCLECECDVDEGEYSAKCEECGREYHSVCAVTMMGGNKSSSSTTSLKKWVCAYCKYRLIRCIECHSLELKEEAILCCESKCEWGLCADCKDLFMDEFRCEVHECAKCAAIFDPKIPPFWQCIRCPKAYCKGCRPESSLLLSSGVLKCVRHLNEPKLCVVDAKIIRRRTNADRQAKKLKTKPQEDEDYHQSADHSLKKKRVAVARSLLLQEKKSKKETSSTNHQLKGNENLQEDDNDELPDEGLGLPSLSGAHSNSTRTQFSPPKLFYQPSQIQAPRAGTHPNFHFYHHYTSQPSIVQPNPPKDANALMDALEAYGL